MLTAEHDTEDGEEECEHQQRPEGGMEVLSEHSHKTDTESQQKTIDTRGDGEKHHLEDTGIEVIGRRLGATTHIRKELFECHNHSQTEKHQSILSGIGRRVIRIDEMELISQIDTQTEKDDMHHCRSERDKHARRQLHRGGLGATIHEKHGTNPQSQRENDEKYNKHGCCNG